MSVRKRLAKSFKQKLVQKSKDLEPKPLELVQFGQLGCEFMSMPTMKVNQISRLVKQEIESLKLTTSNLKLSSASTPSFSGSQCYFVVHESVWLNQNNVWESQEFTRPEEYKAIINPKIISIDGIKDENTTIQDISTQEKEYSISFPLVSVDSWRFNKIQVGYYDMNMEYHEQYIDSFAARIFQHQLDMLVGKDFLDWRVNHGAINPMDEEIFNRFPKFFSVLNQFIYKIEGLQQDFPDLFNKIRDIKYYNTPLSNVDKVSWEDDLNKRLLKNARKDLRKIVQQMEDGGKQDGQQGQQGVFSDKQKHIMELVKAMQARDNI